MLKLMFPRGLRSFVPPVSTRLPRAQGFFPIFLLLPLFALHFSIAPAMAQRPLGTDVSHYQGAGINWTNVKSAGVSFAWAKATEGVGYTDADFAINEAHAKAAGVLIGAYHFARPSSHPNITGANSADSEAAYFWGVVSNYVKPGGFYMVPMLDWEDTHMTNQLSAATLSAWVNEWCNTISNYAVLNGVTGMKPVVYTGTWYSRPSSTYSGLTTAVTIWPSWIAAYPSSPQPQTGGPSDTYPWSTWNFWQYADTNWSGGDSDVFNGTAAGLGAYVVGGFGPPNLVSSPSSRYADRGSSISFRAVASGTSPLRYQWRFNGANIAGATNSICTITNIQPTNAGSYNIVVTNTSGSVTSAVAALTVNGLFTTVFSDDFDTDSSANWILNKSSTDTRIAFAYNYSGYGIPSAPHSTGGTTKGVKFEANVSQTNVAALNISPIGQGFTGNYRLHYDMWINANGPFPAGGTGSTQHQTAGIGTAGNRVQWNSGTSDGVWFAIDGEGQASDTSPDIRAYIGTALQSTNTGEYVGGMETQIRRCSHPYYSNVFPGGQTAPAAQAQSGSLAVGTVGFAWRDVVVNKNGNVVEWFVDGLKYCSITNASFTGSNIFLGYWDTFSSLSDNTNLSFGIVDNVRVEVPVTSPTVSMPPQSITVMQGSNATFAVIANGVPSPSYQWRFGGVNIAGATTSSYTRTNAQPADAGSYTVVLSNVGGSLTSPAASLTVDVPPQFQAASVMQDQTLKLIITGSPGSSCEIDVSSNLLDWVVLTNVVNTNGTLEFNAGDTTTNLARFFRVR